MTPLYTTYFYKLQYGMYTSHTVEYRVVSGDFAKTTVYVSLNM